MKLKTGYFNKLVCLTAFFHAGQIDVLKAELEKLGQFWPTQQPVAGLVQAINEHGIEAVYAEGYLPRPGSL